VKTLEWKNKFEIGDLTCHFLPAGHILGASSVVIKSPTKSLMFSGDLGRQDDPLLPAIEKAPKVDTLIMESTYGGKNRSGDYKKDLHSFLATVSTQSRVGIIASFAVARAQTLLTLIHEFFEEYPQYKVRVVADSPMMKEANKTYKEFASDTNLSSSVYEAIDEVDSIDSVGEWESLKKKDGPLIIISSSGMVTGGRIWRHLKNWQSDKNALLFLPGYQAEGTAGRRLSEGYRDIVDGNGEGITWQGEIMHSDAFSSHADQSELLDWVSDLKKETKIFLLHGEEKSKQALKEKLHSLGFKEVTIATRRLEISTEV
jgi:metallo-beta-lactamase family protein